MQHNAYSLVRRSHRRFISLSRNFHSATDPREVSRVPEIHEVIWESDIVLELAPRALIVTYTILGGSCEGLYKGYYKGYCRDLGA